MDAKTIADALDMLLHMVTVLAEEGKPSADDVEYMREVIARIKAS